jgi:tetratricopeptide (TPR) repeat protein
LPRFYLREFVNFTQKTVYCRLSLLLLFFGSMCACRQPKPSPPMVSHSSPDYEKAISFLGKQSDSAFFYFNKAVVSSKDSLQTATAYNQMAVIQSDASDYFGAQESLSMSLRFLNALKESHQQCLASDYNELGVTSINLKEYKSALGYFNQALRFSSDEAFRLEILNNKAFAYQDSKAFAQALKTYGEILPRTVLKKTYARILNNIATTKWLYHPGYNAAPELLRALKIRQDEKDLWGQNSSFTHLADYYSKTHPDSALYYANGMYAVARHLSSPDDELEALGHLIRLSSPGTAQQYFLRYRQLNDSLVDARNASRNQFALIRYHAEQSKAENLRLQKENAEKKYQLIVRNVLLVVGAVAVLTGFIFLLVWLRRRKIRQEQEKQEAVTESRLKTSKKVHDSLSNDIYLLMKRIKHDPVLDRQWLLEHTENVYKLSRNISYDILADTDTNFHEKIGVLLKSFSTDETKVSLVGNDESLWKHVSANEKLELKYILQEFMVNMQKHSKAANVIVKFQSKGKVGFVTYMDDGLGIPAGTVHQNGLTNTGTRINTIGGRITFGSNDGKGLRIDISFPLA